MSYLENQNKEENNISTMKTYQMPNKWQCLICIELSFSNQDLQNDIVTPDCNMSRTVA